MTTLPPPSRVPPTLAARLVSVGGSAGLQLANIIVAKGRCRPLAGRTLLGTHLVSFIDDHEDFTAAKIAIGVLDKDTVDLHISGASLALLLKVLNATKLL